MVWFIDEHFNRAAHGLRRAQSGAVARSSVVSQSMACARVAPHISADGCRPPQNAGRSGRPKIMHGLRKFPNPSMERRSQIAEKIQWQPDLAGFETGYVETIADDCGVAELLLSIGGYTVRRYFLPDASKSLNQRVVDYRRFDPELQHLGRALKAGKNDSRSLEAGVATLLHLLGASTLTPPNPDTPDVIAETVGKRLALIECTIRVESLRERVGKLVNRREILNRDNGLNSPTREVLAILVVNQPRHTIVNEDKYLSDNQVVLISLEDLNLAMAHLEVPQDLDMLFLEKLESLRSLNNQPFESVPGVI